MRRVQGILAQTMIVAAAAAALLRAEPSHADAASHERFRSAMDAAFGAGKWRTTGGYRTREREDQLRSQGALTVRPGAVSHHSLGTPQAPGAYDVVVDGLNPFEAARRLRATATLFRVVLPEGAHGDQGPHLHLEPAGAGLAAASGAPQVRWFVVDPTPQELAITEMRTLALQGEASAQLRLGLAYAQGGRGARQDLLGAYVWTAAASANPAADTGVRQEASRALASLEGRMKPDELARARRFASSPMEGAAAQGCVQDAEPGASVLLVPGRAC